MVQRLVQKVVQILTSAKRALAESGPAFGALATLGRGRPNRETPSLRAEPVVRGSFRVGCMR